MITRLHAVDRITLDFDDSTLCFLATYIGYLSSADFRDHCEYGLTAVSQKIASSMAQRSEKIRNI
jgi:hypothetical protein